MAAAAVSQVDKELADSREVDQQLDAAEAGRKADGRERCISGEVDQQLYAAEAGRKADGRERCISGEVDQQLYAVEQVAACRHRRQDRDEVIIDIQSEMRPVAAARSAPNRLHRKAASIPARRSEVERLAKVLRRRGGIILVAGVTLGSSYQVGMNPPTSILNGYSYAEFMLCNALAFIISGVIIFLGSSDLFYESKPKQISLYAMVILLMSLFVAAFIFATASAKSLMGLGYLIMGISICAVIYGSIYAARGMYRLAKKKWIQINPARIF